ncbi:phosphohydrolase [Sphingopyxis sp. GW247-27LB]|uniref:phosphohydrolase n=1 Tax=Sphingopyxis sp. GW247-27LB TaxID=2012632 RepID=UPI000BA5886A|nr:phosphohydrolase [Sphingopyxis sp. GW247-27LB]PAL23564.1 phosphohydrolase [Sphingopyxis sp. GW247-27LB]
MTNVSETYDNRAEGETRRGNWMQTYSSVQFWPLDPRPGEVLIVDIAHALSNMCRYAGHCSRFYSVAEHSVLVSLVVPPEHALQALLHDATEAYLVDVPRPIKKYLGGYHEMEDVLWRVIAERFGVPEELHPSIKEADNAVLLAEAQQIMGSPPAPWQIEGEPADVTVECLVPSAAKTRFAARFAELQP